MCMDSHQFSTLRHRFQIHIRDLSDLDRIQGTITVYHIDTFDRRFCQHLQCCLDITLLTFGNCHNVAGCLITFRRCIFDHCDRLRHRVDISSHTDQIYRAVRTVSDTVFVIAASHIRHNGNLHIRIIIPNDCTDILILCEFPFSEFIYIKLLFVRTVSKLHIIHTGRQICFI